MIRHKAKHGAILFLICCLVTLNACAQKRMFTKPGFTQAQWEQDLAQCEYEASGATQNVDPGLRTVFGQALDQALRKNELIALCLRAKGYEEQGG